VVAAEADAGAGDVIAQREAVLREVLPRVAPADADDALVVSADDAVVQRAGVPDEVLRVDLRLVEPAVARVAPVRDAVVDVDRDVLRGLEARLPAEAAEVLLAADRRARVDRAARRPVPRELAEAEVLAEGARELADVLARVERRGGLRRVAAEGDVLRVVAEVELVGGEEEQPVARDRPALRLLAPPTRCRRCAWSR
jgi:hypothetical protein